MKQEEIWKDIPGYEGMYQVSNLGRVKSLGRQVKYSEGFCRTLKEKLLKPALDTKGYSNVILSNNTKLKNYKVHQLVAMAFLGHTPCGHKLVIDHINHIKTDNKVENLRVVTNRANTNNKKKKSTSKYSGVSWHKPSEKWIVHIRINGRIKHLGSYKNEQKAAITYQLTLQAHNNTSDINFC